MKELFTQLFNAFKTDFKSAALATLVIAVGFLIYRDVQKEKKMFELQQQQIEAERSAREAAEARADMLLKPLIPEIQEGIKKIDTAVNMVKDKYEQ